MKVKGEPQNIEYRTAEPQKLRSRTNSRMSNHFRFLFLAVFMLVTNIEINGSFSSVNESSFDAGFMSFAFTIISSHTLDSRNSLRQTFIL